MKVRNEEFVGLCTDKLLGQNRLRTKRQQNTPTQGVWSLRRSATRFILSASSLDSEAVLLLAACQSAKSDRLLGLSETRQGEVAFAQPRLPRVPLYCYCH